MAEALEKRLFALNMSGFHFQTNVVSMKDYDQDNLEHEAIVVAILSTWTGGAPPEDTRVFCAWLNDMATDFRVSKTWLANVSHAIFGLGNAEYDEDYGTAAKDVERDLTELGSPALLQLALGDDNVDQMDQFEKWMDNLIAAMCEFNSLRQSKKKSGSSSPTKWLSQKEFRRQKKAKQALEDGTDTVELNEEDLMNEKFLVDDFSDDEEAAAGTPKDDIDSGVVDVEDIGKSMQESEAASKSREMVTPMQRKALTKEGYKIIGTHSAVKLCRWTKHQLRGRGGCYKHTFYGITSYQCMETTPSLACANKCVFCWRHHKPQEPGRPRVALEDGRGGGSGQGLDRASPEHDQGAEGSSRSDPAAMGGSVYGAPLRSFACGRAYHVPLHQRVLQGAAQASHLVVPRHERAVPGEDRGA